MTLPRVVVAAAASGQGKTTIAVGLMAALARRGLAVAPAKIGPDYIDPGYHALATGRPGRNLDPWLQSEELIPGLLLHGANTPAPADVAIIEGVMGLFDGRLGTRGWASTAHVAKLTESPVLLVLDISSAARTAAAVVHGLRTFDPEIRIAGVLLNKAGSPRHAAEVRAGIEEQGLPVLGTLPRDAGVSAPSRHLGLIPAAERPEAATALDRLAGQMAEFVDLDRLLEIARLASPLSAEPWTPPVTLEPPAAGRPVVAVAGGRAFTFRYAETDELLRALGCEPVVFDPATDRSLPAGTAGLYLGGGFPEVYAPTLATNTELLADVRQRVAAGLPTVAECAGLLYLCDSVDGHELVGAIPARATMHPRLTLRYRTATAPAGGLLGPAGTTVRGHEFHRTVTAPAAPEGGDAAWAYAADGDHPAESEGFALAPASGPPSLHASYLHTHWAGHPELAESFARAVHAYAEGAPSPAAPPGPAADEPPPAIRDIASDSGREPEPDLNHHGDREVIEGLVDLAVNVRLPAPPPWLAGTLRDGIGRLGAYPNPAAARAALARHHGVDENAVLPTNGGAEAFTLLARAIATERPLVVHPQFTEPEVALTAAGRRVRRHILTPADGFVLDPDAVDPEADLIVVGNPTNPTGTLHPRSTLAALRRPGRVLVVDEAFLDAIPGEPESLIGEDPTGVLVLRSLTKTWGLAGLRAGYVVGDPKLVAALAQAQPEWSLNSLAAAAIEAVCTPAARREVDAGNRDLELWRTHLVRALTGLGLRPVPSRAPFVLVRVGPGVREALRARGYAVRRGDTFPGLDAGWIRIAVRDPQTIDGFVRELAAVLDHRPLNEGTDRTG